MTQFGVQCSSLAIYARGRAIAGGGSGRGKRAVTSTDGQQILHHQKLLSNSVSPSHQHLPPCLPSPPVTAALVAADLGHHRTGTTKPKPLLCADSSRARRLGCVAVGGGRTPADLTRALCLGPVAWRDELVSLPPAPAPHHHPHVRRLESQASQARAVVLLRVCQQAPHCQSQPRRSVISASHPLPPHACERPDDCGKALCSNPSRSSRIGKATMCGTLTPFPHIVRPVSDISNAKEPNKCASPNETVAYAGPGPFPPLRVMYRRRVNLNTFPASLRKP
uniref:Uncharacterized protein n=1 Tax=Mycena chlorophos TaxID=658473 RepID=A0ABQ0LKJ2_MYCCL|nr:predicted protein [Mycena chlorophos]